MFHSLETLWHEKKKVCLYTNHEETSNFIYGYILSINEETVTLYLITSDGKYDGVLVKQLSEIFRIEIDTQYVEKMKKLESLSELPEFPYSIDSERPIESLLLIAQSSQKMVELVGYGGDAITGFVENMEDNVCRVRQVDVYGYEDGITFIKTSDITQVCLDSEDERRIWNLWNLNQKNNQQNK